MNDKEAKKELKILAAKNPEQYYPVTILNTLGFTRQNCTHCRRYFWATQGRNTCEDSTCTGGFTFIGRSPAKKQLSYAEALHAFETIHKRLGYTPIKRYPVVARWNPTVDFTIANIAAFQPYVVSGEIEPPANPLVIPQFSLRFNDIDNVGITGSHYVGFVMLGENGFWNSQDYDPDRYCEDHLTWLNEGLGLSNDDIVIHEDSWSGGGSAGPSIEFFSKGLELSNQVYMHYRVTEKGLKELPIKVLDMGQGLERIPWFTQGRSTSYETTFPLVIKKLRQITGVTLDETFMNDYMKHASLLNTDEAENMQEAWKTVAERMRLTVEELKKKLLPNAALYSIAEHTRALLFAIADGALPSNVGGYYNLRVILRRAYSCMAQYDWNINLADVCAWHAKELKTLFPELEQHIETIRKVFAVEHKKYSANRKEAQNILEQYRGKTLSTRELIELYDNKGIHPELAKEYAQVVVPDDFYALVTEKHSKTAKEKPNTTRKTDFEPTLPATKKLYYNDWKQTKFTAQVLAIQDDNVILDQSIYYPTSGGQAHDTGTLGKSKVLDVFTQGTLIVHKVDAVSFSVGEKICGVIDGERRKQLTQHHTATHIVGAAARQVLGKHINQAGARKTPENASIDLTHYQGITGAELEAIQEEAKKIISAKIPINKTVMSRKKAEQEYGMRIYQGGAVPGKELRIVDIEGIDVQACGGTHLDNSSEVEKIVIKGTTKIKDGIVRLTFTAGNAAEKVGTHSYALLQGIARLLHVTPTQVPGRAEELFSAWKKAKKAVQKKKEIDITELELQSTEEFEGNELQETAKRLKTQPEHIVKTIQRFLKELEEWKKKLQ